MPIVDLFFLFMILVVVGGTALGVTVLYRAFAGKAKRFGYPSMGAYPRAAPRSDAEKRDAADLALKGGVLCLLGLIAPTLGGLTTGVATLPVSGPSGIAFAVGLLLYVTGLFAASVDLGDDLVGRQHGG